MKKQYIILLVFLILSIVILLINSLTPVKFVSSIFQSIFSIPRVAIYSLRTSISSDESLEIKKLKDENAAILKKFLDYQKLKGDNEALRSQFETGESASYKLIPARVVGFSGNNTMPHSLIIDLGQKSGIMPGEAVIYKNNLIGKVDLVEGVYSRVILTHNPKFSTLGQTLENNALGIIKGQGDFILLDHVSISDRLKVGEAVVTRGDLNEKGVGVPAGLTVGKMEAISRR